MKKKPLIILLALLLLITYIFIWQIKTPLDVDVEEQLTMQVGYLPLVANLPLFVALEENYFDNYGLKLTAIESQSPNHIVEAIVSGNLDGAGILAYPILFFAEEKFPGEMKLFSSGDETIKNFVASIIVKNDSGINSIEDLKGEKIGVYNGLVQLLFLKSIVAGMGFDPEKDIKIVQISPRLQLQGFEAGQYDVLSTVEPFPTIAKNKGLGKVLVENPRVKYILNPFPSIATPISKEFIDKHPKATKAYVLAYNDAIEFIRNNPKKSAAHLAKYTPVTKELAEEVNYMQFNKFGEQNITHIQKYANWMLKKGLLSKSIDVESMFGDLALIK